jgi:hypothetical protein
MQRMIVEYRYEGDSECEYFPCWAETAKHANEQCLEENPDCQITALFVAVTY